MVSGIQDHWAARKRHMPVPVYFRPAEQVVFNEIGMDVRIFTNLYLSMRPQLFEAST